ncbi:MAG: hypothetical protein JW772_00385 [Candidatus Diapherotrites archaeon]|nr:hypothetical protein [Candidatus Diapherotrites archaeon]
MNKKGVFFTFVIFLLAIAIIVASSGIKKTIIEQKATVIESSAYTSVDTRFTNVYNEIFVLKPGYAGEIQSRIVMPADYDSGTEPCWGGSGDCGYIEVAQKIPADDTILKETYDALNLYAIFVNEMDKNSGDLKTTADGPNAPILGWPGTPNPLSYMVMPQCMKFLPESEDLGSNKMCIYKKGIMANDGCDFDLSKLDVLEFKVRIDESIYVHENWQGVGGLAGKEGENAEPYDAGNTGCSGARCPYVYVEIEMTDCQPMPSGNCLGSSMACCIDQYDTQPNSDFKTVISGHVNPANMNGINLKVEGADAINLYLLDGILLDSFDCIMGFENKANHELVLTTTKMIFDEAIEEIEFRGFSISVEKPNFKDIVRSS